MSTVVLQTFHKEFLHNSESNWVLPIGVNGFYGGGFLRDDSGDEISKLNSFYCELTAQYWAWKNTSWDNVGFFHYRRYLNFLPIAGYHDNVDVDIKSASSAIAYLTSEGQKASLDQLLSVCDVVVPRGTPLPPSAYAQYCGFVKSEPWHEFVHQLKLKYPGAVDPDIYFKSVSFAPICNIFVMKRPIFNKYCEDLFSIINAVFEKFGSPYDDYNNRYPGFLAERFLGYWLHIMRVSRIEVPMVVIK